MKYLLSDLSITESEYDYVIDLIKVYFSLESIEIPQLEIGVHRRITDINRALIEDSIASDISSFISNLSNQGINISMKSLSSFQDMVKVTLVYEGTEIKFTLT